MGSTDDLLFYDSPDNIQKCLNCEQADCTNCLGQYPTKYGVSKYDVIDREKFVELFNAGLTDDELAARFGVTRFTVYGYRKSIGLFRDQPNKRGSFSHDKFMELYKKGMSDHEISMKMNYSEGYIYRYRRLKLKLPSNHPKRRKK